MCFNCCELDDAITSNRFNKVKNLINKIKLSLSPVYSINCVLRHTIRRGYLNIIKHIIKACADFYINKNDALTLAVLYNHLDIVKYFVNIANYHNWNKEIIQIHITFNNDKNIVKYLKYLPIQILYMKINACNKIQKWYRCCLIKKYSPYSNHVKYNIKPRFELMQI